MSRGLNKVMIIGHLGRDPEMRYTPSGRPVTTFSVATGRSWHSADGERHEETEWFNLVSWGSLAAAELGLKVLVVDKANINRSGAIAGGIDHFHAFLESGEDWDTREAWLKYATSISGKVNRSTSKVDFIPVDGKMLKGESISLLNWSQER